MPKSFKYRLYPNQEQKEKLTDYYTMRKICQLFIQPNPLNTRN